MIKYWTFSLLIFMLFITNGLSQVGMQGGRGLLRVQSANVVAAADIYISTYYSNYFEKIESREKERLATLHTLYVNATVGLSHNFEASLQIIPYQEDQKSILGRFGDTQLALKYMIPFTTSAFQMGLQSFIKFPTAYKANVPYEVFSTDKIAWGWRGLFTFDFTDLSSSYPFKYFINAGYYDHDMGDVFFSSNIDQLLFATGFKFPIKSTQIFMEYSGEIFINSQDSVSFSENPSRLTLGVTFLGPRSFTFDVVGDIGLMKRSSSEKIMDSPYHKMYADWRIWFGATYRFSVFKYFDKTAKLEKQKREQEQRKLERIKRKRIRANRDIQKMKEILDKKKKSENK